MREDGAPPPGARRLRRLSEEEIELWLTVAASVARRPGSLLPDRRVAPPPVGQEASGAVPARADAPAARAAVASPAVLPPLAPLERKLKQRLSRGRETAAAALDLHGFRQAEALSALRRFLAAAQRDGLKVVLVVTGKGGRPAPHDAGGPGVGLGFGPSGFGGDVGVLRRSVPLWLAMPEFRPVVLGYEEAARSQGGSGALYVRLRRRPPPV